MHLHSGSQQCRKLLFSIAHSDNRSGYCVGTDAATAIESVVVLLFYDNIRVFLGLVRGLWSIVSIMEYPDETINIREGMGTAVRNVTVFFT